MTLDEEIRRGDQAKALLEHPLLVEAFNKIETEALETWRNTAANDTQTREKLYLSHKLLNKLKAEIQEVVTTGEIAKKQSAMQWAQDKVNKFLKAI